MHLEIRPRRQRMVAQAPCLPADGAMGDRQDPKAWCASHGRESLPRRRSSPSDEIPSMPSLSRRSSRQRHLYCAVRPLRGRPISTPDASAQIVFFRPCGFPGLRQLQHVHRPPPEKKSKPERQMMPCGPGAVKRFQVERLIQMPSDPRRERPNLEVELRNPGPLNVSARTRQNNPISGRLPNMRSRLDITAKKVRPRICRSSHRLQLSTYLMSRSIRLFI